MDTTRTLGRSGIEVSAVGFGCWAIGGEWRDPGGQPLGWGTVDDQESVRAIRRALDLGVTFFDTADVYGTGHSEEVLGRALGRRRDEVVVATKWGNLFDPDTRTLTGGDDSPEHLRRALTASLRRLGTEYIDLYQLHLADADMGRAARLRDACEDLVTQGLVRSYAWSTDDPERAAVFAKGPHCTAVQHALNVLTDAPEMLRLCEEADLASVNRSPLAMGLLTGKHAGRGTLPEGDHPQPATRLAAGVRCGVGRGPGVARAGRGVAGRPHQRGAHPRPGRPRLAVGAQSAHRADPRLPVGRPGGGERGGAGEGRAHGRADERGGARSRLRVEGGR